MGFQLNHTNPKP
ncbi:unnamed protein product, partial [Rotaria sp. Silwood1]